MKKKRRLTIFDIGGIKLQEIQEQTQTVDPNAERLERLRQQAAKILADNEVVERQRQEANSPQRG